MDISKRRCNRIYTATLKKWDEEKYLCLLKLFEAFVYFINAWETWEFPSFPSRKIVIIGIWVGIGFNLEKIFFRTLIWMKNKQKMLYYDLSVKSSFYRF